MQAGFGMIEIMVAVTVGIILFLGIEQYLNISLAYASRDNNRIEALYLAKSMLEQARAIRDESWSALSNLTIGNQYKFIASGGKWAAQSGIGASGKYDMWIETVGVQRDANKNIVSGGGTNDIKDGKFQTLKIIASVSWDEGGVAKQIDLSEYLANFK